jgi:hypothetical protein
MQLLANFNLEVNSCARELQKMQSELLSKSDALRVATFEEFSKGLVAVNNAIAHVKLFGRDTRDEQIQAMIEFANSIGATSPTREAGLIIETMLDKFGAEYQMKQKIILVLTRQYLPPLLRPLKSSNNVVTSPNSQAQRRMFLRLDES